MGGATGASAPAMVQSGLHGLVSHDHERAQVTLGSSAERAALRDGLHVARASACRSGDQPDAPRSGGLDGVVEPAFRARVDRLDGVRRASQRDFVADFVSRMLNASEDDSIALRGVEVPVLVTVGVLTR